MPGMVFTVIDVRNSIHREALRLDESAAKTKEMVPVFEHIFRDMLSVEERIFHGKGRRGGGSWKRLDDGTVRKKGTSEIFYTKGAYPEYSQPGFGNDTLVRSLTVMGARFQVKEVTNEGIVFGTDRPYAKLHQEGSKKHPARPFIRFLPSDWKRWAGWVGDHVVEPFEEPL
jgi:phage gpG-like protein